MKLNDLEIGKKFILVRNGEKYIKGKKHFYNGKPTSRFDTICLSGKFAGHIGSLNQQCEIKAI